MNDPEKKEESGGAKKSGQKKKGLLGRLLKYFALLLLIVLLASAGGIYWAFQTESGQGWLLGAINKILAPADSSLPPLARITSISGSLPFNFRFGLELEDQNGIWLRAPDNAFTLNWREMPGAVHISAIKLANVDLSRFPTLPDSGPKEPRPDEKPFTFQDFLDILDETSAFLAKKHWWLPEIRLEGIGLENALLPAGLVEKDKRLRADAHGAISFLDNRADISLRASARNSDSSPVALPEFSFNSASLAVNMGAFSQDGGLAAKSAVEASISGPALKAADLPAGFLGDAANFSLGLEARTTKKNSGIMLDLAGPKLDAGHVQLSAETGWRNGPGWLKGELDGPLNSLLNLKVLPVADASKAGLLSPLRSPATLAINISGELPRANLDLRLDCAEIEEAGHKIKNLALALGAEDIRIPLNSGQMKLLEKENHVDLDFKCMLDEEKVSLATLLFFQQLKDRAASWRIGLRDLRLEALGAGAKGAVAALLSPGAKPGLDGSLQLSVSDWKAISKLAGGHKFAGNVDLRVDLASMKDAGQTLGFKLNSPSFSVADASGEIALLNKLTASVSLANVFEAPVLDCRLDAGAIKAADMELGAIIQANGPIAGPLKAEISTRGNVASRLAATWKPGSVDLEVLEASLDMPALGRGTPLGVRATRKAQITYGDDGLGVRDLDVRISPSGRMAASGLLSPQKLDFRLALDNLDFMAWRRLLPQLPGGSASLAASLTGSPQKPAGKFRLALDKVSLPKSPLAPISAVLSGAVENRGRASFLAASLDLDPRTLKSLGATNASVKARIPLSFGANGLPAPDMQGALAAAVRWKGAIGPIWNLLPIADQRLNGRLDINLDASGTLARPRLKGGLKVEKARYENVQYGVLLTDINVNVGLKEDAPLKNLEKDSALAALPGAVTLALGMSDGRGGRVNVNGAASLDGGNLDINAKIDKLRPLRRRDVHIELSGAAKVAGKAAAPVITGEVIVNQGEINLDNLAFTGSVTTLPITDAKAVAAKAAPPPAPAAPADQGSLNLRIRMLPRFDVVGRGLTSVWEARLLLGGSPADPRITGNVSCVKGNFDFLGKNFILTKGLVTFAGGAISNPLLDVELTNETPDLVAHIIVTGAVSKMKLTLASEPELPRDEILSQVLFGKSVNDLSRLEALQLAGAVAQLAGLGSGPSGILNFAKKTLGVDVLRLGSANAEQGGQPGDQTAAGTTLEMGKYVTDKLYMGVQQGMKADSTAFIIQLELTPRTDLEVRTEQNNTWGGIKWKYNY